MCLKYKPKQQITNAGVSDYKLYTSHCLEISNPIPSTHPLIWSTMLLHLSEDGLLQGVTNIKFWYERIFEYIYIQKTIQTNIWIYSHQKNDTNMIRTNIRIGKYSNIFEYPNIRHTLIQMSKMLRERKRVANSIWKWIDAAGVTLIKTLIKRRKLTEANKNSKRNGWKTEQITIWREFF